MKFEHSIYIVEYFEYNTRIGYKAFKSLKEANQQSRSWATDECQRYKIWHAYLSDIVRPPQKQRKTLK